MSLFQAITAQPSPVRSRSILLVLSSAKLQPISFRFRPSSLQYSPDQPGPARSSPARRHGFWPVAGRLLSVLSPVTGRLLPRRGQTCFSNRHRTADSRRAWIAINDAVSSTLQSTIFDDGRGAGGENRCAPLSLCSGPGSRTPGIVRLVSDGGCGAADCRSGPLSRFPSLPHCSSLPSP